MINEDSEKNLLKGKPTKRTERYDASLSLPFLTSVIASDRAAVTAQIQGEHAALTALRELGDEAGPGQARVPAAVQQQQHRA